ncbi:MAG: thiamine pyrophosphate-dependent dehydrogenase E1 component subunit alpha [Anaerolineales bacterium]|jgi:TPP-dependent pyruvate/acetoin dehydrogenase alpha subunit
MASTLNHYRSLCRIRFFEETLLENFPKGVFSGTTHTYLGQEANAVGILSNINDEDVVVSNHRCHGHFLAYGGDMRALYAELMGKLTGVCGGRGGSQHIQWKNFYSNGVLGGTVPLATGMALAEKYKKSGAVTICFLGDGTLGEGVFYESLNMASLWNIPVLYVVENNKIAQTTPIERSLAGGIALRFEAFDISTSQLDTSDVFEVLSTSRDLLTGIRTQGGPRALIIQTVRFGPHSKGDDTRDQQEISRLKESRDPLKIVRSRLDLDDAIRIQKEVEKEVHQAYQQALDDPLAERLE